MVQFSKIRLLIIVFIGVNIIRVIIGVTVSGDVIMSHTSSTIPRGLVLSMLMDTEYSLFLSTIHRIILTISTPLRSSSEIHSLVKKSRLHRPSSFDFLLRISHFLHTILSSSHRRKKYSKMVNPSSERSISTMDHGIRVSQGSMDMRSSIGSIVRLQSTISAQARSLSLLLWIP